MITTIIALVGIIAGAIGGFIVHAVTMKIEFKQRTIDNKIKVYDALIGHVVQVRNYVYSNYPGMASSGVPKHIEDGFDRIYGDSQQLIGEIFLFCEDRVLAERVNTINEKMYRTEWQKLSHDVVNARMEEIKEETISIIVLMREDIKSNTILHRKDLVHIWSGLFNQA
jgi:hypothetical protein